jgi:hypothetical protein
MSPSAVYLYLLLSPIGPGDPVAVVHDKTFGSIAECEAEKPRALLADMKIILDKGVALVIIDSRCDTEEGMTRFLAKKVSI